MRLQKGVALNDTVLMILCHWCATSGQNLKKTALHGLYLVST